MMTWYLPLEAHSFENEVKQFMTAQYKGQERARNIRSEIPSSSVTWELLTSSPDKKRRLSDFSLVHFHKETDVGWSETDSETKASVNLGSHS